MWKTFEIANNPSYDDIREGLLQRNSSDGQTENCDFIEPSPEWRSKKW